MTNNITLQCIEVSKTFRVHSQEIRAVDRVSLTLSQGEICAVVGPSGSGKTTLMALCAGLDYCSGGTIRLFGQDISRLDEDKRATLRAERIGFVFQNFHLLSTLTAIENVLVPAEIVHGRSSEAIYERAAELLARLGLGERLQHYPSRLSGGEQQRVALARAFITQPDLLFADEPTGNLDKRNAESAIEALRELNERQGTSILLVTHNRALAEQMPRCVRMEEGRLVEER